MEILGREPSGYLILCHTLLLLHNGILVIKVCKRSPAQRFKNHFRLSALDSNEYVFNTFLVIVAYAEKLVYHCHVSVPAGPVDRAGALKYKVWDEICQFKSLNVKSRRITCPLSECRSTAALPSLFCDRNLWRKGIRHLCREGCQGQKVKLIQIYPKNIANFKPQLLYSLFTWQYDYQKSSKMTIDSAQLSRKQTKTHDIYFLWEIPYIPGQPHVPVERHPVRGAVPVLVSLKEDLLPVAVVQVLRLAKGAGREDE